MYHVGRAPSKCHGCYHDTYVHMKKVDHALYSQYMNHRVMELVGHEAMKVVYSFLHAMQHVQSPMSCACYLQWYVWSRHRATTIDLAPSAIPRSEMVVAIISKLVIHVHGPYKHQHDHSYVSSRVQKTQIW